MKAPPHLRRIESCDQLMQPQRVVWATNRPPCGHLSRPRWTVARIDAEYAADQVTYQADDILLKRIQAPSRVFSVVRDSTSLEFNDFVV